MFINEDARLAGENGYADEVQISPLLCRWSSVVFLWSSWRRNETDTVAAEVRAKPERAGEKTRTVGKISLRAARDKSATDGNKPSASTPIVKTRSSVWRQLGTT